MIQRKHYIDNLRTLCILLLVPFHTCMAYNSFGEASYIHFADSRVASTFLTMISPWYMSLMFVLAGMSAKYSLSSRTPTEFIAGRVRRLLLPLIVGTVTLVPIMTYCADVFHNGYSGTFFGHYAIFFTKFTDLSGYDGGFSPAHLWFLLYLFIISLISLIVITLQKQFVRTKCKRPIGYIKLCLFGLLPTLAKPILDISGKSVGTFLMLFLLGYYLFTMEDTLAMIKLHRRVSLAIFILADTISIYLFIWSKLPAGCICSALTELSMWFGIMSAIGYGQSYLDFANHVTVQLTKGSFSFYIWHFVWLIICQFCLSRYIDGALLFFISIALTYLLTFVTVAVIHYIKRRLTDLRHAK